MDLMTMDLMTMETKILNVKNVNVIFKELTMTSVILSLVHVFVRKDMLHQIVRNVLLVIMSFQLVEVCMGPIRTT